MWRQNLWGPRFQEDCQREVQLLPDFVVLVFGNWKMFTL